MENKKNLSWWEFTLWIFLVSHLIGLLCVLACKMCLYIDCCKTQTLASCDRKPADIRSIKIV